MALSWRMGNKVPAGTHFVGEVWHDEEFIDSHQDHKSYHLVLLDDVRKANAHGIVCGDCGEAVWL